MPDIKYTKISYGAVVRVTAKLRKRKRYKGSEDLRFDMINVGPGHDGAQVAIMLRAQKFTGAIAIIGEQLEPPSERPPLSKEYLAGETELGRIQPRPAKYWDEREVTMRLGKRVTSVDPAAHNLAP